MKLVLVLSLFCTMSFAKTKWSNLYVGDTYRSGQEIHLQDGDVGFKIPRGTKLKLISSTPLPMINVHLYKFKVRKCPDSGMKTDLELLEVENTNPVVVIGYDLVKGCKLEVFIEQKDVYTRSFFSLI